MESNSQQPPEEDEQDQLPPNFTKEQVDKLKSNRDFRGYAYFNLIELLTQESDKDKGQILAEAKVYAKMLKPDKKSNQPMPRKIS